MFFSLPVFLFAEEVKLAVTININKTYVFVFFFLHSHHNYSWPQHLSHSQIPFPLSLIIKLLSLTLILCCHPKTNEKKNTTKNYNSAALLHPSSSLFSFFPSFFFTSIVLK